ncbi:MAG TPA: CGNR zinc finger domain-containing protein [Patescibacteria group bacterium]|nr:CGNR zinc finger domain-containing protein [Patescibacteria group bacterium]
METVQPHDHAVDLDTALDFVNTLKFDDGQEVEVLGTTAEALDWLHHHGLVHYEVLARSDVASVLRRIHRTRAALRELADATYEHRAPAQAAVDEVNRALRAREVVQLVPGPGGLQLDHRHVGDPIDDALANLSEPIVREIAGGRPERLRACADDTCRWVFYDDSRTGRRRWCDMSSCGNKAKAARHRARVKGDAPAPD